MTKDVLASERFVFLHAGKTMDILVELQEVRTSRRNDQRLFERTVSYDYAVVFSAIIDGESKTLHEIASHKEEDLKPIINKIQIKRSKKRTQVAIGYEDQLVVIFGVFKGNHFVSKAPLLASEVNQIPEWSTLNLENEPSPRQEILRFIEGDKQGLFITGKTLSSILTSVKPEDELNWAFLESISSGDRLGINSSEEEKIILHNRTSKAWRNKAIQSVRAHRANFDPPSLIRQTYLLGGKDAIIKEDHLAFKQFQNQGDLTYFETRIQLNQIPLDAKTKKEMIQAVQKKQQNFCQLPRGEQDQITSYLRFLKAHGNRNIVFDFIQQMRKSSCVKNKLHSLNNEFLFATSSWSKKEQKEWAAFAYEQFHLLPSSERKWNYDLLEKFLTCNEQRTLLTKYKKDIDVFNDKQVPVCE